jgi:hypothetical protein
MTVARVQTPDLVEFARRYHYTQSRGGDGHRWGLWDGPVLHGVVNYNLPTRSVCGSVFGPEHGFDKVWHMSRLVCSELSPRNSESRLIGGSLRAIEREHPYVWAVLTYAATDRGHIGTVYQATNALYTGEGGDPKFYIDGEGNRRGTHLDGRGVSRARATELGWTLHVGGVKHRYVYILGSKTQRRQRRALLKLDVLPYPKAGAS